MSLKKYLFGSLCTASLALLVSPSFAQSIEDICVSLSNSGLTDTRNRTTISTAMSKEFNHVCEFESQFEERMRDSSNGFKSAFKSFRLDGTHTGSRNSTTESVKASCEAGEQAFLDHFLSADSTNIGSLVADAVVDCAAIAAQTGIESFLGTTSVSADDTGFNVLIRYTPGEASLEYTLEKINVDGTAAVNCGTGTSRAEVEGNLTLVGSNAEVTFSCTKPPNIPVSGSFEFQAEIGGGQTRRRAVKFDVQSRNLEAEQEAEIERRVRRLVPKGMVVAFLGDLCPTGWQPVPELAGRVIIGVGVGDGLSPRAAGEVGGTERHALTGEELPQHAHGVLFGWERSDLSGESYGVMSPSSSGSQNPTTLTGGGAPHNNMQPFMALNYCARN